MSSNRSYNKQQPPPPQSSSKSSQRAPTQPPSQQGQRTGVEVEASFIPLQFLLYFCNPTVVIDGRAYEMKWGTRFFPLNPGNHNIQISFKYLFMDGCGANRANLFVREGQVTKVIYRAPLVVFSSGKINVYGPRR